MQHILDTPECSFCHSEELQLFYGKSDGLMVQCVECGYSCSASDEHLASASISLVAS
ncbi:MAG: hypothetical protein WCO08_05495 [Actinomycetes bacterium]